MIRKPKRQEVFEMSEKCEHKFFIPKWIRMIKFNDKTVVALIKCKCSDCNVSWSEHREYTYTARILNTQMDRAISSAKHYNSLYPQGKHKV
jgi:hypothetical protein